MDVIQDNRGWSCRTTGNSISPIRQAALDQGPISGLTHQFYRYPARFSPRFARAAIEAFSSPGGIVLDPFMGGGTSIVEAQVLGRRSIGNDINSLAVFVASVKVSVLGYKGRQAVKVWARRIVRRLRCNLPLQPRSGITDRIPRNMTFPEARWLKKTIAQCMDGIESQITPGRAKRFARCVVLNVGQWALNGRRRVPTAEEFRARVEATALEMLDGLRELQDTLGASAYEQYLPVLREGDAENLHTDKRVLDCGLADLVVTSPPYPGIHMLYHRWQVDGRKETDAPYWIAASNDGAGAAFYNFADRRRPAEDRYFDKARRAFASIRNVMRDGAVLVQLIAFSDPQRQLRRYLRMLEQIGFCEMRDAGKRRTWRVVPSRRWHANSKGDLSASREVLLLHVAR